MFVFGGSTVLAASSGNQVSCYTTEGVIKLSMTS